jgi:DNA-binding XRE family transcriptional regulator
MTQERVDAVRVVQRLLGRYTIAELSHLIGVPKQTIHNLRSGERVPQAATARKILAAARLIATHQALQAVREEHS